MIRSSRNSYVFSFFLPALFCGLTYLLLWTTKFEFEGGMHFLTLGLIKAGMICVILTVLSLLLYVTIIRPQKIRGWVRNLGLMIYAFLVAGFILEGIFVFVAQSQVAGTTLAYKRWMDYYWHPINQLKFRDAPIVPEQLRDKKIIMALGDSFTAGHGIKRVEERFSDRLASMLPDNYAMLNLGKDGVDTSTELYRLYQFPIKPDILIFQYYGNDIEGVCVANGYEDERDAFFERYNDYPNLPQWMKWPVKNSYLLNFAYWQAGPKEEASYFDFVVPCFEDRDVLRAHLLMLKGLVEYSKREDFDIVVVIFPFMMNLEESAFYVDGIKAFFGKGGVPVLDVRDVVQDIPPKKRVVGKLDMHAGPLVHERIADELIRIMAENGYIEELAH